MLILNLGAGTDIKAGMVNIDLRPLPGIDKVCDVRKLPYADCIVDKILAIDIIEHFGRNEVVDVLKEWHRVLKPGGVLILRTPDLRMITEDYLNAVIDGKEACRRIFGNQDYKENTHRCIFDGISLADMLMQTNFRIISMKQTDDRRNLYVRVAKP